MSETKDVGKDTVEMPSPKPRMLPPIPDRGWFVIAAVCMLALSFISFREGTKAGERRADARYSMLVDDVAQRDQRLVDIMDRRHAELTKRLDDAIAAQTAEIESRVATLRTSAEELKRATAVLIKSGSDESMEARFTRWVGGQTLATWRETFSAYRTAALNSYFPAGHSSRPTIVQAQPEKVYKPLGNGAALGQITVGQ